MPTREVQSGRQSPPTGGRLGWLLLLLLIPLAVGIFGPVLLDDTGPSKELIPESRQDGNTATPPYEQVLHTNPTVEESKVQIAPASRAAQIRFIDSSKRPMPGALVSVALRTDNSWSTSTEFVSDRHGVVSVPDGYGRPARLFAPEGFTFRSRLSMEPRDVSNGSSIDVVLTDDSQFTLRRVAWLRWDVTYADGQCYSGPMTAVTSPDGRALTLHLTPDADPEYEWHIDQWESFKVSAQSRRPGFSDARNVEVRPVADSGKSPHHFVAQLALQAGDSDLGNIEVDLTAFRADRQFRIAAKSLDTAVPARSGIPQSIGDAGLVGGTRWFTRTLIPGEYQVLIVDAGNGEAIRPDDEAVFGLRYETVVAVHAGATTVVSVPTAIETGSVTLRVVDSNGLPISGAVATVSKGEGNDSWSWFSMKGWTPGSARVGVKPASMTGADGSTTVHGLAPLRQELVIHAIGYASARLVVTPAPLRIEEAGEVTLQLARGLITITIDHGDVPMSDLPALQVLLLRTGGSAALPKQKLEGPTHTFTGLDDGDYTVAVLVDSGWQVGRSQNVKIGADSREHSLSFELRRR